MRWDSEPPGARRKQQDGLMRSYLAHKLYAYSPFYRAQFDGVKLEPRAISGLAELVKVPATTWGEVVHDAAAFVLRPDEQSIARYGDRRLVAAVTSAKIRGRTDTVNRSVIEPAFKPVHWLLADGVPIGYSSEDMDRLALAGSRLLQVAGLDEHDVLVNLAPAGAQLGVWQLVTGARHLALPALHLGSGADPAIIEQASPTVLAGERSELLRLFTLLRKLGHKLPQLHTLLVLAESSMPVTRTERQKLAKVAGPMARDDLVVVGVWAPKGARALWGQCPGGAGFHTYPDLEWLEVIGQFLNVAESEGTGELLWSSLAWHGTALFRLRTGITVTMADGMCPTCDRIGPRLLVGEEAEAGVRPSLRGSKAGVAGQPGPSLVRAAGVSDEVLRVIDRHRDVAAWHVERREVDGEEELLVFVAPKRRRDPAVLCRSLDESLHATQYIVLGESVIRELVGHSGQVTDLRRR